MWNKAELEMDMNIDEILNCIMIATERKDLVNQIKKREIACWLWQVWLYLEFCFQNSSI